MLTCKKEKRKRGKKVGQFPKRQHCSLDREVRKKKERNSDWLPRDRVMYLYFGTRARLGPLSPSHGLTYTNVIFFLKQEKYIVSSYIYI